MTSTLKRLAKELLPAFKDASPADTEDGISFCCWVRDQCGEDLTLNQAERLQEALTVALDALPKVVIYFDQNIVYRVDSNTPLLRVFIVTNPEGTTDDPVEDCIYDVLNLPG
jgi:hypothetical protein